ncbi:uncharacterized protein VTP21DRAFT_8985 [Calcarisporiella thermophila]|uniref:uncharacterized protein n=1 Tax=Calcarisporiella thermophila TaxID=911321 RepID=UPI003743AD03
MLSRKIFSGVAVCSDGIIAPVKIFLNKSTLNMTKLVPKIFVAVPPVPRRCLANKAAGNVALTSSTPSFDKTARK